MTDTPRTEIARYRNSVPITLDANDRLMANFKEQVHAEFARQLERELNAANAEIERLRELLREVDQFIDTIDYGDYAPVTRMRKRINKVLGEKP